MQNGATTAPTKETTTMSYTELLNTSRNLGRQMSDTLEAATTARTEGNGKEAKRLTAVLVELLDAHEEVARQIREVETRQGLRTA